MIKKGIKQANIMGVRVASSRLREVLEILKDIIDDKVFIKPYFVVTAYSEFFLEVERDEEFRKALSSADLIVADGVSVWAAADFVARPAKGWLWDLLKGIRVGYKVISGSYTDRPEGVKVFKAILENAGYKKFLLGGFGGVAGRLAGKFGCGWAEEEAGAVEKIDKYGPDVLFVALGRFKQEKWIARNIKKLKCRVVMGVGSAFDEVAGEGKWAVPVPDWVNRRGLKWLWRVGQDQRHVVRAIRAAVLFPMKLWGWYETT